MNLVDFASHFWPQFYIVVLKLTFFLMSHRLFHIIFGLLFPFSLWNFLSHFDSFSILSQSLILYSFFYQNVSPLAFEFDLTMFYFINFATMKEANILSRLIFLWFFQFHCFNEKKNSITWNTSTLLTSQMNTHEGLNMMM